MGGAGCRWSGATRVTAPSTRCCRTLLSGNFGSKLLSSVSYECSPSANHTYAVLAELSLLLVC